MSLNDSFLLQQTITAVKTSITRESTVGGDRSDRGEIEGNLLSQRYLT